jgi:hypothetical protein
MSLLWFVHFLLLFYKIITLFAAARRGRCLVIIRRIGFLNRYSRGRTDSRSWSPNSEPPSSAPIFRSPPSRARITPYLASWLAVLKADKKAIFTAASKASEAATFLAAQQGA